MFESPDVERKGTAAPRAGAGLRRRAEVSSATRPPSEQTARCSVRTRGTRVHRFAGRRRRSRASLDGGRLLDRSDPRARRRSPLRSTRSHDPTAPSPRKVVEVVILDWLSHHECGLRG